MPWLPYTRLHDGTPRPYLTLWRDPERQFSALIDSGSDDSSIPLGLASTLGIRFDPDRPRRIFGAGGYYRSSSSVAATPLRRTASHSISAHSGSRSSRTRSRKTSGFTPSGEVMVLVASQPVHVYQDRARGLALIEEQMR